ncbi:MAG TPA: TadE/TadG family type IV pilus assembly protein [Acidothermaceae bacterium]|nr:TadE/TadG family type IV pilus assembly protein [Acidothermaceae bacterium]
MIRRLCRSRRHEDGAVAILVALLSVVLFGFGALVIDIGHAQVVRSQSQSTVDAASLAGVRALASPGGTVADAVTAVRDYVKENMGITDWTDCKDPTPLILAPDPVDPTNACISTLTSPDPGVTSFQVRVKLPTQHVPATFGGLFGVSSIGISPVAQALSGQPLPPECGPCDPALDESTGQPQPQAAPTGLPAAIRAMLPDPTLTSTDPGYVPPAGPLDTNGCPTTPGIFTQTDFPTGVTIGTNPLIPVACTLHPGLYVFDGVNLDVSAIGSIASTLAGAPINPSDPPAGTGVTLVFYGAGTLTVEGHIGTIDAQDNTKRDPLVASDPDVAWQPGQPIPGVAIVLDQIGSPAAPTSPVCAVAPMTRCFSLGDDFTITGSVYALDGQTTWTTNPGDCMPVTSSCAVHDEDGAQSVLATTSTAFSDPDTNNIGRIPTVATDHPMAEPPPSPPHLVK